MVSERKGKYFLRTVLLRLRGRVCFLQQNGRGEHGERDLKRDQMEKLVREELERWDSEASMNRGDASPAVSRAPTAKSSRGSPSRASQASAASVRTVSFNDHKMRIITCLVRFSTCNFFFSVLDNNDYFKSILKIKQLCHEIYQNSNSRGWELPAN